MKVYVKVVRESEVMDLNKAVRIDDDNESIKRIKERCINCGRCKTICEEVVGIKYDNEKAKKAVCINCGQCILNCPVASLVPKYDYKKVLNYLHDTEKIVTISPLKEVGFDYVFDVTFGADMTVMEEATELVNRIKNKETLPMFTSCCPSWVKYLEIYHPEKIEHLSTVKSPIGIQSSLLNTYFLKMNELDKKNIINVVVVPCTSKKFEIKRTEMGMDIAITTNELVMILKESNIDITKATPSEFSPLFSKGSGSGTIFGRSGGVMEATLRCANYLLTEKDKVINFLDLAENNKSGTIKRATVNIGPYNLRVAAVTGMPSLEEILKELDSYDFIEVMNCPNGCVGGGGQVLAPIAKMNEISLERGETLTKDDNSNNIRFCYENPDVINIYKTYLDYPNSPKALKIIHTNFKDRSDILGE